VVALLPLPLRWGGEENGKKKGKKLVHCHKGSLTEQQNKENSNTDKKNIQKAAKCTEQLSPPNDPHASELRLSSPPGTQHDSGTCYCISCFIRPVWVSLPGCVPSWLLVKNNLVLAEPRTLSTSYSIPSMS